MSKGFISIWCAGCRIALRNRQSLSRHQKKSGCSGSYNIDSLLDDKMFEQEPVSTISILTNGAALDLNPNAFNDLNLNLGDAVKGRSLADIIDAASCDIPFVFKSDLLFIDPGAEHWSRDNGVEFIMNLDVHPIPGQLVIGTKIGTQAVFMKL
jgi:hypothetical protein